MCGRYSLTTVPEAMRRLFAITGPLPNYPARYNIAPKQSAPIVRLAPTGERELALVRWGLVQSGSTGPDSRYSMINARAELVASKPAYRRPFRERRCLVPADGFYEWTLEGDGKQPHRFTLADGSVFAFAGLWDRWQSPSGEAIESFTIIVTEANALVRRVHDRMPVMLDAFGRELWLDPTMKPDRLGLLLKPFAQEAMTVQRVSRRVNSPTNDDEGCIAPAE